MNKKHKTIPVVNLATFDKKMPKPKGMNAENKCSYCSQSKCCQYSTVEVETPRSIRDFDNLVWHVSHLNTHLFKDTDGWYLVFYAQCQHLEPNGNCGIYEKRPFICREHTNDHCEYDMDIKAGAELYFMDYEELDNYCAKRFKNWHKRFEKL
ncbi:YkgJ family cysteine cluster protein [Aliikangiella marina]|nr:YkgJ family cysteine cluster protein [Aliikangiella marina]